MDMVVMVLMRTVVMVLLVVNWNEGGAVYVLEESKLLKVKVLWVLIQCNLADR
jgi:hypothetical protein